MEKCASMKETICKVIKNNFIELNSMKQLDTFYDQMHGRFHHPIKRYYILLIALYHSA